MLPFLRVLAFALAAVAANAHAGEPPMPAAELEALRAVWRERLAALDPALAAAPRDPAVHSRRGDCHLFLGRFADAVTDFETMIALDPALDAPHWRLGIAYYFAGQFARSSAQFQKYHAHDGRDRENGLWKFLGDVPVLGAERARKEMLVYTAFDREPFPGLYALFAGTTTSAEFFTDLATRKLTGDARVMFFANYYAGLHEAVLGQRAAALARLHAAVANPWGRTGEHGPAYMWQVARLHYEQLASSIESDLKK